MRSANSPLYLKLACSVKHLGTLSLRGKGGESFGFLSGFPHAHFHSSFRTQCLCFSSHNPGRKNRGDIQQRVGKKEEGFQWVDWRGFDPLNRSTCSSGISWKQSSILVPWGCLLTPWILMAAWVWSRFLVLSFGVVLCENSLSGLTPGYAGVESWTLADHWLTAELLVRSHMQMFISATECIIWMNVGLIKGCDWPFKRRCLRQSVVIMRQVEKG